MFEHSWIIEISRVYTISLTKISTSWVCVLYHALNYCVESKTRIRNSLINRWLVKCFINNHGITKTNFIFWITCPSIWLSPNKLIDISSCCIYTTWFSNSWITAASILINSILFTLRFYNWVLGTALIQIISALMRNILLIRFNQLIISQGIKFIRFIIFRYLKL